jgi:hypothetical protein
MRKVYPCHQLLRCASGSRNKRPAKAESLHTRFFRLDPTTAPHPRPMDYYTRNFLGFVRLPRNPLRVIVKIGGRFCSRAIESRTEC